MAAKKPAPKKETKGILSKPPKKNENAAEIKKLNQKLASGQGDSARIKTRIKFLGGKVTGGSPNPSNQGAAASSGEPQAPSYEGLNQLQATGINQQLEQGNQLGGVAGGLIDDISQRFSAPVDYSTAPEAVVGQDFNRYREEQLQQGNQAFDARMNPIFQQQNEEFDQKMAMKGIPMGSPVYNQEKSRLEQSQNDARQQGYYQAAQTAGQNAEQFFNIGTSARQNAMSDIDRQRYGVLNDYNALMAPGSGLASQNLAASQGFQGQEIGGELASQLSRQGFNQDKYLQAHQPRGGGGGGAAPPIWIQRGYASYQDMIAADDARARGNLQFELAERNKYAPKQPKGPSVGAQVGGGILGAIGQGLGNTLGNKLGGFW